MVGSPLKKQRASLSGLDEETMRVKFGLGLSGARGDVLGAMEQDRPTKAGNVRPVAEDKGIFGGPIVQEKVVFGAQPVRQEAGTVVKAEEMEEEL